MKAKYLMDLFDTYPSRQEIVKDVVLLKGLVLPMEDRLLIDLTSVVQASPFRHMITPGGFTMSVAMANCGALGWVTDDKGYRYTGLDPLSHQPWPAMPDSFTLLAQHAASEAGFNHFSPDACLINQYQNGARMGLHQDKDERDLEQPIVSVSLGVSALFQLGGFKRFDTVIRIPLHHGDVVVWGGESRLRYHGVLPLKVGNHPAFGERRINLTFRKAG